MLYVIADTRTLNQRFYAFDSTSNNEKFEWKLVEIENTKYDNDGSVILTIETIDELKNKSIAVFESKKQAKLAYIKLDISSCRYVKLAFNFTHEYKLHNAIAHSA